MQGVVVTLLFLLTATEAYLPSFKLATKALLPSLKLAMSSRLVKTENPYLEDVCEKYADVPGLTMMCVGSVYWNPPIKALTSIATNLLTPQVNKYGSILGDDKLRNHLQQHLVKAGLDMTDMDLIITAGANQAFNNVALTLCDPGDKAVLIAPYYFGHKLGLQLSGAEVSVCPFDTKTLAPNFDAFERMVAQQKPKVVVMTSPNNPSGYVYTRAEVQRIVSICKQHDAWLVADQTYYEFLHDDAEHVFPCGKSADFAYEKIIHVFSFSKIFGMPGWRVGYLVYPKILTDSMRKIQDTIPTHAARLSQDLAFKCMELYYPLNPVPESSPTSAVDLDMSPAEDSSPTHRAAREGYSEWAASTIGTLTEVREQLYPVLAPLGTIFTKGAYYYLIPVPPKVSEEEAVDILAREYGVLLMPAAPFGAPGNMRMSYGSLPPSEAACAIDKVKRGLDHLQKLSAERV